MSLHWNGWSSQPPIELVKCCCRRPLSLARQKPHREFLRPTEKEEKGRRNPPGARTARLTGSTPGVVRPAAVRASLDVSHPYLCRLTKRVVAPMWNVRTISEYFPLTSLFGLQVCLTKQQSFEVILIEILIFPFYLQRP